MSLTHLDEAGRARMVDVGDKPETSRMAIAEGYLTLPPNALKALEDGSPKGNVFETARIAGIMGAKRTSELIPLCHPLPLTSIDLYFETRGDQIRILATAGAIARTGVEMEALTAVSIAALTVYDMLKSASKGIKIEQIRLLEKSGGKSGLWRADGL